MGKNRFKFIIVLSLILLSIYAVDFNSAKAESTDTATLRIMATGDLHGQVTSYDYETDLALPKNGLCKIATLVEQNKEEIGSNNTILVDAGDFLYDYTTNYFYDNYPDYVQPILSAMKIMDYDYIALGNHEFDYPWDYLSKQLKSSGMSDNVLVCNTIWHDNGKKVFNPSAIITKYLTLAGRGVVKVKVGIIGSTTNSISTRRGDYVNEIDAANNYDSIVAEADRLKRDEKVDIVVVVLHGGIGSETTNGESDNIGYALTKVKSIDAIVTGHTHEVFPDTSNPDITVSNINEETGCINGKPVVATKSYARALGVIDLNLSLASDGTISIASGKSRIDYVTEVTKEYSPITTMFCDYQDKLKAGADTATYKITKGIAYHNYDTVLQDSNLYQLFNNAKISYGIAYIAEFLPAYKNVPVIACTRNLLDNNEGFMSITGTLSSNKVSQLLSESSFTRPSGNTQLYELSGKDLREWLEYNVSIYATKGTTFKNLLKNYVNANPQVSTLLQDNFIYNWNRQYVFDGISYTVDLTKKARYSSDGELLSSKNKRITSLTYNGVEVTNSQKFVLVSDSGLPSLSFLPEEMVDSIKTVRDYATGKGITLNYIKKLSAFGSIGVSADHNWALAAGADYSFILGVPKKIINTVSTYSWNKGIVAETTSYSFLKGTLPGITQKVNLVVTQGRAEVNNEPVPVIINATSKYAIKQIKYVSGMVKKSTDSKWNNAGIAKDNTFLAASNGIYTVLVTDAKNNHAISYVTVDRYDANLLASPKLDRLTNRNSTFTGTAVPNSVIYVTIGESNYFTKVIDNGAFRIDIKPPKAFSKISGYVEYNGIKSSTVTAAVRKTGPDAVQVNRISIGNTYVTGNTDPDTTVYALIWSTIYVGIGQTDKYKASEFYSSKYKIIETNITVDPDSGVYSLQIPPVRLNMKVFVYAMDRFGITSKATMQVPVY